MKRYRGTVKNHVVVLEEGAKLPEGSTVEVRLLTKQQKLDRAFEQVMKNRITRHVGMQEIIDEDKLEREQ